jgi:hypothetical protein
LSLGEIIEHIVNLAGIPLADIYVDKELYEDNGKKLLEYRGETPLYLFLGEDGLVSEVTPIQK